MYQHKPVSMASQCLAIVLERLDGRNLAAGDRCKDGTKLFHSFQEENRASFWNPALVESVNSVELVGFMRPNTLLVSGTELHLECLRGAWARRVLKAPRGLAIKTLGDIGGIEMQQVPQTQFIPLPDTLCVVISNLNNIGHPATLETIAETLQMDYAGMSMPRQEVVLAALGALAAEGKLYCMGEHYFVATPLMYQQYQANLAGRGGAPVFARKSDAAPYFGCYQAKQELCTRECQTGASIINAPAYKPKRDQATCATADCQTETVPEQPNPKSKPEVGRSRSMKEKEKPGFFARLFRRSKSRERKAKAAQETVPKAPEPPKVASNPEPPAAPQPLGSFQAQFPPPEWLHDPRFARPQAQAFKSRKNRSSKERHIWLEANEPKMGRRSTKDRRFSNQRYCTFPENLNNQISPEPMDKQRQKNLQRMSKYLSSSSECLHYLGPVDPPNLLPRFIENEGIAMHEPKRKDKRRKRNAYKQDPHLLALEQLTVSEPLSPEVITQPEDKIAPLAVATDVDLDTTGEASGCRTSTPVDKKSTQETVAKENSDSAFSASPVVTEMSSDGSNRYSSWSGSEGQRPIEMPNEKLDLDHTYVNLDHRAREIPKSERRANDLPMLSENLDSTNFENVSENLTAIPEEKKLSPTYISAV